MTNSGLNDRYEIKIKEHIQTCWQEWFDGWEITSLEDGEILLGKTGVDHSELHGILNKIRDLNLTLLAVTRRDALTQSTGKKQVGGGLQTTTNDT
jgi:hypothetical protein